jgi:2-oxoisovalerate dehydrogenase E1 component
MRAARYATMQLIRRFEEQLLEMRRESLFVGSTHLCLGQEIVPAVVSSRLSENDRVIGTYRGHGWALALGADPEALFAEVLGRETGVNGGRGGSAYLSSPETRFLGENSIVGAGLPIANGVAMAMSAAGQEAIVVVDFGDGATNQGATHEALVFAVARQLPVLFVCENNGWSEMTPIDATVPGTSLASRASAYGMRAEQVDGSNPASLLEAVDRALSTVRTGAPAFLEVAVPRLSGHYNADIEHYRPLEDKERAAERDPLAVVRSELEAQTPGEVGRIDADIERQLESARTAALAAPMAWSDPSAHVVSSGVVPTPKQLPVAGEERSYGQAANLALHEAMKADGRVVVFGEDVAIPGGVFGVTRNLLREYGRDRVFDTPISESAILGAAVGAAQSGLRPVVEIMWSDFLLVALDQLVNQAANVRYLSRGTITAPMVVRTQQGTSPGSCAQHSQSLEAVLAHTPGLKIGIPSTAHDAYTMLRSAISDPDPCVIIESRAMYLEKGVVDATHSVEAVGGARLEREGTHALIISWGRMMQEARRAAEQLESAGVDVGLLDLRWIAPLDIATVLSAVRSHGGRVVIVHEATRTGGFGAELATRIHEAMEAERPVIIRRVATPDTRIPASPSLLADLVPNASTIRDAVARLLTATSSRTA